MGLGCVYREAAEGVTLVLGGDRVTPAEFRKVVPDAALEKARECGAPRAYLIAPPDGVNSHPS